MKLWLLCFFLIFAVVEGFQGLSGGGNLLPTLTWHPLTVLAGIGLAVLSNATALGFGAPRSSGSPSSGQPAQPPLDTPATPPPPAPPSPAIPSFLKGATQAQANAKANSISFAIRKPPQRG